MPTYVVVQVQNTGKVQMEDIAILTLKLMKKMKSGDMTNIVK